MMIQHISYYSKGYNIYLMLYKNLFLSIITMICLTCSCSVVVIVCSLAFNRGVVFVTCFPGALHMHYVASCIFFSLIGTGTIMQV